MEQSVKPLSGGSQWAIDEELVPTLHNELERPVGSEAKKERVQPDICCVTGSHPIK